ncbi:MAG TPA: VOC family protein [Verrucomicrobiae bacterium]|nr:VOC family protein [Verrucomicrobiae bacterium]
MSIFVHLIFNGNCAEAFAFYEKCLRGKIEFSMTYGESPMAAQMPPEAQKMVMHTSLAVGDFRIAGADAPGQRYKTPQGFDVALDVKDEAEADRLFSELSQGGKVEMPIQKTFWAKRFGMCVDRFGIPWMVNCSDPT